MTSATPRRRAAILISGRGSNMEALIAASNEPGYPAEIVGVISDKPEAAGLATAAALGIAISVIRLADHSDRVAHEAAVDAVLRDWGAEIVCLAGYMRILSPSFVQAWAGRLINIHPSLLPAFPGLDTHRRALEAGSVTHGCTVHFVTAAVDGGPIIAKAEVPVLPGDTEAALAARVLAAEHRLYPAALAKVAT